ncbi:MAG: 6-bladed beta-propeller [bacterium]
MHLIKGPGKELIVSDTGNSRVVRFTQQGDFVGIVGRRGEGPGEFLDPGDIDYVSTDSTLWVVERNARRFLVSVFRLQGTGSSFLRSFTAQGVGLQGDPGLIVLPDRTFLISPRGEENRLHRVSEDGVLLAAFGELWVPSESTGPPRYSGWNGNHLVQTAPDTLALVWVSKPEIEVWTVGGAFVRGAPIPSPPLLRGKERQVSREGARPVYVLSASYEPSDRRIYLLSQIDEFTVELIGLSIDTFEPEIVAESTFDEPVLVRSLVTAKSNETIRFFAIENRSAGVITATLDEKKQPSLPEEYTPKTGGH